MVFDQRRLTGHTTPDASYRKQKIKGGFEAAVESTSRRSSARASDIHVIMFHNLVSMSGHVSV